MVFKILSLDPGLTTLGWAISTYDSDTDILSTHKFGKYQAVKNALKDKDNVEKYGQRLISVTLLRSEITRLVDLYKPTHIASEDVFLHIRHINAFAALTMCIFAIKDAAKSRDLVVYTIPPRAVKKLAAATGEADKLDVQQAILSDSKISITDNKQNPIDKMSEHEADAIAVAKAFTVHFVPQLLSQNTATVFEDADVKRKRKTPKKESIIVVPVNNTTIQDKPLKPLSDIKKKKLSKK